MTDDEVDRLVWKVRLRASRARGEKRSGKRDSQDGFLSDVEPALALIGLRHVSISRFA